MASETRDLAKEIDTLKKDFEKLRDDLASLVSAAGDTAGDQMKLQRRRGLAAAESAAGQTAEAFEVAAKSAGRRSRESLDALEQQVAERPITSVLVALCVGVLIGRMTGR